MRLRQEYYPIYIQDSEPLWHPPIMTFDTGAAMYYVLRGSNATNLNLSITQIRISTTNFLVVKTVPLSWVSRRYGDLTSICTLQRTRAS